MRFLLAALAFLLAGSAFAQCANTSYGNGVTCVNATGYGGGATNMTTKDMAFSPAAGHAIIVSAYQCWDSNCLTTGSATMTLSTNINNPEACFTKSPGSPFTLLETGAQHLQQYMWYCPSIPAGVNNFRLTCVPSGACNYMTGWVSEWTGLTTTSGAGAFDGDGGSASTGKSTTATITTNVAAAYHNNLYYSSLDNTQDLAMTVVAPFKQINQFFAGNVAMGTTLAAAGIHSAQTTWTGVDDWYGTIMAVKSAASTLAVRTAATCSSTDVATQITAALDGDTINVPAGNCTWTTTPDLPAGKALTIQGAGAGSTNITMTGQWVVTCSAGFSPRITGFRFIMNNANGVVHVRGTCSAFRFDHNEILNTNAAYNGADAIWIDECQLGTGRIYGLADHNTFTDTAGNFRAFLLTGPVCSGSGNVPWPTSELGTGNNFFIEDNTFNFSAQANGGAGVIDSNYAARYVFRHNSVKDSSVIAHGVCNATGTINHEVYGNTLIADANYSNPNGYRLLHDQGGGESMVFDNTFTAVTHGSDVNGLTHYRSADPVTAGCNLLPRCDGNDATDDGNFLPKTTYFGYPCYHQPGRKFVSSGNKNALSPIYYWNNLWSDDSTIVPLVVEDPWGGTPNPTTHVVANRDFYDYVKTGFNGTVGTGRGLLSARPATCTTSALETGGGVGYFATDTNTLYRCSAANTWVTHYTPYPYPHPLSSGGGGVALLPPPTNIHVRPKPRKRRRL